MSKIVEKAAAVGAERRRLAEDAGREKNWKRWGPYLSERQWGTVREDYSAGGDAWGYFPHEHARSRAYRWGEDGLLGLTDREGRLCFALALWNERDHILKERLFGLTNGEGNHGEDVKEHYFYIDSTPTHSYMKALYKYPQDEFPYGRLLDESRARGKFDAEFELSDTGLFDGRRYFDVFAEYANGSPNDILVRITVANRAGEAAVVHLLPTIWFRNTWAWGREGEGYWPRPLIEAASDGTLLTDHESLGRFRLAAEATRESGPFEWLFTENETNTQKLYGAPNRTPYVKDAFHEYVVRGNREAVNPERSGTKAAAHYRLEVPANGEVTIRLRLFQESEGPAELFGAEFDETFAARMTEADEFYDSVIPQSLPAESRRVARQAYAGLLWTKQFYHYIIADWLAGDPNYPPPPESRREGRNYDWLHLYNRDVVSMPDKWEYPWYAAWDLAFHMIPFSRIDPQFAKDQLVLFLREWYMHPSGKLPSYEWAFNDANPPVHAWACWRVYQLTAEQEGRPDRLFLERIYPKLLVNFTQWVNRQDKEGKNLFAGGFLGLDNIGLFDRSQPLPNGAHLQQADGTAWMGFYCAVMLEMAMELARDEPEYEDIASKFFEHFVGIVDAINALGEGGLWDDEDGFYYDEIKSNGRETPLRVRSMVGLIPLIAVVHLDEEVIKTLPGFAKRLKWFLENRKDLARYISYAETSREGRAHHIRLLSIPSRERLEKVLRYLLDETEFLSPHGFRSLSRAYERPYVLRLSGQEYRIGYDPAESTSGMFGGNSNWRGPVWLPVNFLLVEALEKYHYFYGDELKVECPRGSGRMMNLSEVSQELTRRLTSIFTRDEEGRAPWQGVEERLFAHDPHWRDLVLFYEYFHGDTGRGIGASHQTGWTALVASLLDRLARNDSKG